MMTWDVLTAMFGVAALWSIACRINQMRQGRTSTLVFVQFAVLAMGIGAALVLTDGAAKTAMMASVAVFLALGMGRWRRGAPPGIVTAPAPLDELPAEGAHRHTPPTPAR